MIKCILFLVVLFAIVSVATATPTPEQQAQAFVFALHDNPDLNRALPNLVKDSPAYASHPERLQETAVGIERVLKEFGPIRYSRLLKKEEVAPVLIRLFVVSDTAKGPVFWGFTFYRQDPKIEDWVMISIRVSGSAEDILR